MREIKDDDQTAEVLIMALRNSEQKKERKGGVSMSNI